MPAPADTRPPSPLSVRFPADALAAVSRAAEAAGVPLRRYIVEATLAVAERDGFLPPRWRPKVGRKPRA
jgi:uncharacterized protein (DUF1778 family)